MATYYKTTSGYIAVTKESPPGFKGILFAGRGGTLDAITEQVYEVHQLQKLPVVNLVNVPPEWVEALGYDEILPLLDEKGENLVDLIPVERLVSGDPLVSRIGMLIGIGIGVFLYYFLK